MSRPARRAVARWAWRLFAREWRQQLVILGVISIAVAAAICSVTAVFNVPASSAATFGTAQQLFRFSSPDSAAVADRVAAARQRLGTIEVIGHQSVPIPGTADSYDSRAQDPNGPFAASTLRLRDGRFPGAANEVAITDQVAKTFAIGINSRITIAGNKRVVVGLVENPLDLGDQFLLVPPTDGVDVKSVTILADATSDQLQSFRDLPKQTGLEVRGTNVNKAAAAAMLAASTVLFLLVALVAAAGFAVVAQRRMRQLGMLAAVGANDRHLKMVLLVHGAMIGATSSVLGTVVGLAGWFSIAHRLEPGAGHRIDALNLPVSLLIGALVAGFLVPIIAAWWPGRALSRVPIVDAISARPPKPTMVRTSILAAVLFLGGGVLLTALSNQSKPLLLIPGMVSLVVGTLLICPSAIRLLSRMARRTPVTIRVALRDLGRYQARAGAALAAISVALGIPLAVVLVASAADRAEARSAGIGNLDATELLIRINQQGSGEPTAPNLTPSQLTDLSAVIDNLAKTFGNAAVIPLEMAMDPSTPPDSRRLIDLGEPVPGETHRFSTVSVFVATPQLLSYVGIDPSTIASGVEVLTSAARTPILVGAGKSLVTPKTQTILKPSHSSLPQAFITQTGLDAHNLQPTTVGWIVKTPQPLTTAQLSSARQSAVSNGFHIEARHGPRSSGALRTVATTIGAVFALAIVAMTVGTIRSEAANELRTLTATGASSTIRRALTAATATSLAIAGVVLGVVGAYLGLIGAYVHHLDRLGDIPVGHLVAALIGVPLLSCGVGWCLGGREPTSFSRPAID